MRALIGAVFRAILWGWVAFGLTCLLIEALQFGRSGGPETKAAPILRLLFTYRGHSGS